MRRMTRVTTGLVVVRTVRMVVRVTTKVAVYWLLLLLLLLLWRNR